MNNWLSRIFRGRKDSGNFPPDDSRRGVEMFSSHRPEAESALDPSVHDGQASEAGAVQRPVSETSSPGIAVTQKTQDESGCVAEIGSTQVAATQGARVPQAIQAAEAQVGAEWQIGDVILDLYEVKEVHQGGMGLVYRVHHRGWGVDVAVKCPRADYFRTADQKEVFYGECEAWMNLSLHPNIVTCHYVRTLEGLPRVFAEYVEGGSLKAWIDTKKLYTGGPADSLKRILDVTIQFAEGLNYAHEQGRVHQDVKPANVMMTPDCIAKVTDFGLAKAIGGMTPAYCSPEQASLAARWGGGEDPATLPPLTRQTDLWSWAVSVLEMFTGGVSWGTGSAAREVLANCLEQGSEDPTIPAIPERLGQLLGDCFMPNPGDRPNGMGVVAARLKGVYAHCCGEPYPRTDPQPLELRGGGGLNNRAVVLVDLGKHHEAEEHLRRALEQAPCYPAATYNLWSLLWKTGRATDEEVVAHVKAAMNVHPEDWQAAYLLGLVHRQRGDPESAIVVLKAAIDSNPENVDESLKSLLSEVRDLASTEWQKLTVPGESANDHPKGFPQLSFRPASSDLLASTASKPCGVRFVARPISSQPEPSSEFALRGLEARRQAVDHAMLANCSRLDYGVGIVNPFRIARSVSSECVEFLRSLSGKLFNAVELGQISTRAASLAQSLEPELRFAWYTDAQHRELDKLMLSLTEVHREALELKRQLEEDDRKRREEEERRRAEREQNVRDHFDRPEALVTVIFGVPGERTVVTGHLNGTVAAWDAPDNSFGSVRWAFSGNGPISHLTVDAKGKRALSGNETGSLMLWDIAEGKRIGPGWECNEDISTAAILPSGMEAIVAGRNGTLHVLDFETSKYVRSGQIGGVVRSIAIAGSGERALTGDDAGYLRVWDLASGKCTAQLRADGKPILHVAVTLDGKWYWTASNDGRVRMWQASTGICMRTDRLNAEPLALAVSGTGCEVAIATRDGRLLRYVHFAPEWLCLPCPARLLSLSDARAARSRHEGLLNEAERALTDKRFADAVRLADEATHISIYRSTPESRAVWTRLSQSCARTGVRHVRPARIIEAHTGPVESIALAYDEDFFSQGQDGLIYSYKLQNGNAVERQRNLKDATSLLRSLHVSSDGLLAVINYVDEHAAVICNTTGEEHRWVPIPYGSDSISALAIAVDGRAVMAAGDRIKIHGSDGTLQKEFATPLNGIFALQFSVDGEYLLAYGPKANGMAGAILNTKEDRWVSEFLSPSSPVLSSTDKTSCFSPDGRSAAIATTEPGLEMWDVFSGERVLSYQEVTDRLFWITVTPDARFLAAGGHGGFTGIWDARTGRRLTTLTGPDSDVTCAEWLSGGSRIAIGYDNGEIWIWEIEWDVLPEPPVDGRGDVGPIIRCFLASQRARRHRAMEEAGSMGETPSGDLSGGLTLEWREEDFGRLVSSLSSWGYAEIPSCEVLDELKRVSSRSHKQSVEG